MNKQELEFDLAFQLVGIAADVMEHYHDEEDVDAALQALFATTLEIVSRRNLKPMEEIFR
jgi:hypothetical protein